MDSLINETHLLKGINLSDVKYDTDGYLKVGGVVKDMRLCFRPGHKEFTYQTWAEEKEGKFISHNYGHAGLGYCLSFGTAKRAIANFEKLALGKFKKDEEITIVGLGVIGLTTAIELHNAGYTNIKLIGEEFGEKIPSFGAGALINICFNELTDSLEHQKIFQIDFNHSCKEFKRIVEGTHELITQGVRKINYYTDEDFSQIGILDSVLNDVITELQKVNVKIEGCDFEYNLHLYKTFHVVSPIYMNHLLDLVSKKLNFPISFKKVTALNELKSSIIFNCSGNGSKLLANDPNVVPILGHSIILDYEDCAENIEYILNFNNMGKLGIEGIDGNLYFMPKISGFIGGTFVVGSDGADELLNKQLNTKLINNARFVFNGIIPETKINVSMTPKFEMLRDKSLKIEANEDVSLTKHC